MNTTFALSMSARQPAGARRAPEALDLPLLVTALALLGLGLVMVGSASITIADRQWGAPFHYLIRQGLFIGVAVALAVIAASLPLRFWEKAGPALLLGAMALLLAVFIPGVGKTVNGSARWIGLGPVNLQASELVKLAVIIYLAGYLVRRDEEVRDTVAGFLKPMAVCALVAVLLLAEPDFGAAAVITATVMGMMFLAGVRWWLFGVLLLLVLGLLALLAVSSPYRLERLTTFLNPWADPFNSGFQLTQALIAFGRGEWFGAGLGGSVQKLFYLPEAHTDFLFAVLSEELGLVGGSTVVLLFAFLVWRAFQVGRRAARAGLAFGGHLAHGLGLWIALQAFINIGVNMGVLPTKGLTLPLMSYGGSSMIASCGAVALLLRIDHEARQRFGATSGERSR
jgi:cell division protein FtsW